MANMGWTGLGLYPYSSSGSFLIDFWWDLANIFLPLSYPRCLSTRHLLLAGPTRVFFTPYSLASIYAAQ